MASQPGVEVPLRQDDRVALSEGVGKGPWVGSLDAARVSLQWVPQGVDGVEPVHSDAPVPPRGLLCGPRWGPADLTKPTSRPRAKSAVAGPLCHELRHRSATHEKSLSLSLDRPVDGLKMWQLLERLETNSGRRSLPKSGTRSQAAFRRGVRSQVTLPSPTLVFRASSQQK